MNWTTVGWRTSPTLGMALLMAFTLSTGTLHAGEYYGTVPLTPTVKIGADAEGATPVGEVFGKEYSHTNWFDLVHPLAGAGPMDPNLVNIDDHNAFGVPDPLQVVSWDGLKDPLTGNSGSVDAFDYGSGTGFQFEAGQVDALANRRDFLFNQVVRNEASLLFSVTADLGAGAGLPGGPFPVGDHVHWEAPVGPGAGLGVGHGPWAEIELTPAGPGPGPGVNHHTVEDLDALEVWGPEPPAHDRRAGIPTPVMEGYIGGFGAGPNTADADRFSLDGDAFNAGTSVFAFDIGTNVVSSWIPHSEIVAAVEELFLGPGLRFDDETRNRIDVDATMARDLGDASPTAALWDPGDELLFSIDPIDGGDILDESGAIIGPAPFIDGGEIMHLVKTAVGLGPGTFGISFLKHGLHTWDTGFDVAGTFGYTFEDVDALEAVGTLTGGTDIDTPEPGSLTLLILGLALAGLRFRRRCH